jgi:hypothetical protein
MLVKCPCGCGHEFEINPAALLGSSKKTMTTAAIEARRTNASKPRPNAKGKSKPRKVKE